MRLTSFLVKESSSSRARSHSCSPSSSGFVLLRNASPTPGRTGRIPEHHGRTRDGHQKVARRQSDKQPIYQPGVLRTCQFDCLRLYSFSHKIRAIKGVLSSQKMAKGTHAIPHCLHLTRYCHPKGRLQERWQCVAGALYPRKVSLLRCNTI